MRKPTPIPAIGEGKRGEQGRLGYLLRQANATQRQAMEQAMADLGVTSPQFVVLTMLNAYPGISSAARSRGENTGESCQTATRSSFSAGTCNLRAAFR